MVADLGCGPGHIAKYLRDRGVAVVGIDLSPAMVRCATRLCPGIEFRVGDITALDAPAGSFAGLIAFYSIVHFTGGELESVFREWRRVLVPGAAALVAFHIGYEVNHVDDLWGRPVSLDFRFHQPATVMQALTAAGFTVSEVTERDPYPDAEYPSQRCYLFARAATGAVG